MKNYKTEIDNLHWTETGKKNLINRVEANVAMQKSPKKQYRSFSKGILIAAAVSLFAVTAYATGGFGFASEVFAPIFGGSSAQTEIIDNIGHPIGVSDTSDGITISADAIIGDSHNACVIFSIANEDGTPFVLPEGVSAEDLLFEGEHSGTDFPLSRGGLHGSSGIAESKSEDGKLQIIEMVSTDEPLPKGKKVTAQFANLTYLDQNEEKPVPLSQGTWKLRYELNYENTDVTIPVDEQFTRDGLTFTVKDITISPVALKANYTVDGTPQWSDSENGKESDQDRKECDRFMDDIEVLVTKKDGYVLDVLGGGYMDSSDENITLVEKGGLFDEVVPMDEIVSVTVGDVVVYVNK